MGAGMISAPFEPLIVLISYLLRLSLTPQMLEKLEEGAFS